MAEVEMEMELVCAVYGEPRDAKVEALQRVIFGSKRYKERYTFAASDLTLYVARKDGRGWLKDDDNVDSSSTSKCNKYFGPDVRFGEEEIHILVGLPVAAMMRSTTWWLVTGVVETAVGIRGACSRIRIYQIADTQLGYYDPINVVGGNDNKVRAIWYESNSLKIHVLFKKEIHALRFQSRLGIEFLGMITPPFVSKAPCPTHQQRIFFCDHVADGGALSSPKETMFSSVSTTEFSVVDPANPLFKHQRIEALGFFGPYGTAISAPVVSKSQFCCRFAANNDDEERENNRLALSREMHGAYSDQLGFDFPVVNMEVVSISAEPVLDNRYKVELHVSVYSHDYVFLLRRLKDESTKTNDPLVMKTFVYVENPTSFCTCMTWKFKKVEELRQDFFKM